jgi:hypothetical protein
MRLDHGGAGSNHEAPRQRELDFGQLRRVVARAGLNFRVGSQEFRIGCLASNGSRGGAA